MDRLINVLTIFLLLFIFVADATFAARWMILLGLVLATIVAIPSFILCWITLDGVFATILLGTVTLGVGGWGAAGLLVFFFLTGSILSNSKSPNQAGPVDSDRRTGKQVWANGFWFAFFLCLWYILGGPVWWAAAAGAMATAAADTWATEFGSRFLWGKTILITSGRSVPPGTDGGMSIIGTISALAAALVTGLLASLFQPAMNPIIGWFVAIAGFVGCLADSWLGAVLQQSVAAEDRPVEEPRRLDNDGVNGLATAIGALTALMLTQWVM